MYARNQRVLLRHYLERGLSKAEIARELGVARRTVYHWIATGQLERELDDAPMRYAARPPVTCKVDPFRGILAARLAEYPKLSAVRLFEEIRAGGYAGGYTQVKDCVRQMRPTPVVEPVVRFETAPGHQGQVDFAEFRLPWGKRYALVVVLGYSRLLWLQFYTRQTMLVLMRGLEDAEFMRFAAHWDFRVRACRPYRAQTKGKVERPIGYVRQGFFYGRTFLNDADLNAQALSWLAQTANRRLHRTTAEAPRLRFERDERVVLRPLAARPYRSLVATASTPERSRPSQPPAMLQVERRPLAWYDRLTGVAR